MAGKRETKSKNGKNEGKRAGGRGINWSRAWMPVLAVILIGCSAALIFSALQAPQQATPVQTAAGAQQNAGAVGANSGSARQNAGGAARPTAVPLTIDIPATIGVGGNEPESAGGAAGAGECKLFKNKFTSEFKCFGCDAGARASAGDCVYAPQNWLEVAQGSGGRVCVAEAGYAFKCKSVKA
jgi:hypothetical protein